MSQVVQISEYHVEVATADGTMPCFVTRPELGGSSPIVLFFPNAAGVQDETRDIARLIAGEGYCCLLPNLYYRLKDFHIDMSRLLGGGPEAEAEYSHMISAAESVSVDMAMADAHALLATVYDTEGLEPAPMACLGISLGAGFALAAASVLDWDVAAAACFYGARLMTEETNSPHLLAASVKAEVLLGFAETDVMTPLEVRQALTNALDQSPRNHMVRTYSGTEHGFLDARRPVHHPEAAAKAWRDVFDLFERRLGPRPEASRISS